MTTVATHRLEKMVEPLVTLFATAPTLAKMDDKLKLKQVNLFPNLSGTRNGTI